MIFIDNQYFAHVEITQDTRVYIRWRNRLGKLQHCWVGLNGLTFVCPD